MNRMVAAPLLGMVLLIGLLAKSGSFLKIDDPAASDVIVVLAGEADKRAERGLALLRKGYAPRLVLDVPADTKIYNLNQLELAQKYVQQLPDRERISICPIHGTSTTAEVKELPPCLTAIPAKRVLVVTSDYHTRRALSICRKLLPQHEFQIAAAEDAREFGVNWWQQREWAKTSLEEWSKLIWWGAVDQWQ